MDELPTVLSAWVLVTTPSSCVSFFRGVPLTVTAVPGLGPDFGRFREVEDTGEFEAEDEGP